MMRAALCMVLLACACSAAAEPSVELFHYDVRATFTPGGDLAADVTVTLPAGVAPEHEFVLSRRFELEPVELGQRGGQVTVEPKEQRPLGELHSIRVRLAQSPTRPATVRFRYHGPVFASDEQDRLGYTPECIEMALELMWLPFVAQLNQRFSVDADMRGVPADMIVVAQGAVRHKGDRVRIKRRVGDFDFAWTAVRGLKVASAPGVEFYARDLDDPLAQVLRKHALAAARFHQQWFGPLPGGPIRLALVPRKAGGAYARVGYTVIAEGRAPGDPPAEIDELSRAATVAHEFAHAWWSPADPLSEDYWLAESIAQYSSWRYLEATFGRERLDAELGKARVAVKEMGPVLGHGRPSRGVLYTKTPLLLMDLEKQIGREQFDRVLHTLAQRPPRKTQEFMSVLREIAGRQAALDFESWLRAG
ncbi:MAG TPA: hypothetical protein VGQ22_22765 [Steroidobacteraceae bacterium]|nr:hypothetical protein [Steroidobacteraceae bacterium]